MSLGASDRPAYPARRDAYYLAAMVFTASAFSFLDRQVLAILVDPIRRDLHVSDTGMSLLYGFAFVVLYSTLGLPIGRLIDRRERRLILAAGVAGWSVMTIACGLAQGFTSLFLARVGVGIGEACLTPAACSLLADCFEPRVRGRAMSFYLLGVYLGVGLSMAVGGALYEALATPRAQALLGGFAAWRAVFVAIGAPGLIVAGLMLTIKEPARQDIAPPALGPTAAPPLIPYLGANAGPLAAALVSQGLMALASYALMAWAPSVLIREQHQARAAVGLALGLASLFGGIVGAPIGAVLCDRWTAKGVTAAKFAVCALGAGLAAAGFIALPLAARPGAAFAAMALCLTALPLASASGQTMVQELFPNPLRGQGSALSVLLIGLFGAGCGPLIAAQVSARLFHGQQLSLAIASVGLPAMGLTVLLFVLGRRGYEALRQRLRPEPAAAMEASAAAIPRPRPA